MRKTEFTVVFSNHGYRKVRSFSAKDGVILAQAEQIRDGMTTNVSCVKNGDGIPLPLAKKWANRSM